MFIQKVRSVLLLFYLFIYLFIFLNLFIYLFIYLFIFFFFVGGGGVSAYSVTFFLELNDVILICGS